MHGSIEQCGITQNNTALQDDKGSYVVSRVFANITEMHALPTLHIYEYVQLLLNV